MKAANDNLNDDLIGRTREVWQPRLGRDLSRDEAKQIAASVTGFFAVLAEWSRAAMAEPGAVLMIGEGIETCLAAMQATGQANKLSRTWATLLDALNKHRGKGQQKVTVEHVHVHPGGQAVVGTIERPGGGDRTKMEEQPHAKQIENAPEPMLWREDAEGHALPIPRDGERPLPDARRNNSRRAGR